MKMNENFLKFVREIDWNRMYSMLLVRYLNRMSNDVDYFCYLHPDNRLNIQFDPLNQKVNFAVQLDANILIEST